MRMGSDRSNLETFFGNDMNETAEEDQCQDFERQLRMVEREIEPLLTGVQVRTSEQRSARLRSEVRRRAAAVRCMQVCVYSR